MANVKKLAEQIRRLTEAERIQLNYRIGIDDLQKRLDLQGIPKKEQRKTLAKAKRALAQQMQSELGRIKKPFSPAAREKIKAAMEKAYRAKQRLNNKYIKPNWIVFNKKTKKGMDDAGFFTGSGRFVLQPRATALSVAQKYSDENIVAMSSHTYDRQYKNK